MATIKTRTSLKDGRLRARILIKHPMDVGGGGRPAHFIKAVECALNGVVIVTGHWGAGISKNPYLAFNYDGAAAGDVLRISWRDNRDESDSIEIGI